MVWNSIEGFRRRRPSACRTHGRLAPETVCCGDNSRRCRTAACSSSPFRRCPTAVRRDPMNVPRSSPTTSSTRNRSPRSCCSIRAMLHQAGTVHASMAATVSRYDQWVGPKSGKVMRVDPATRKVFTGFDDHSPAVANIIPAQRAGKVAIDAGLDEGAGYCAIDPETFESARHRGVYMSSGMPRSPVKCRSQASVPTLRPRRAAGRSWSSPVSVSEALQAAQYLLQLGHA